MSRTFWFLAGSASGVYAAVKARRTAQNFTPDGLAARVAALRAGARVVTDEVNAGRVEREADLLAELRASSAAHRSIEPPTAEPTHPQPAQTRSLEPSTAPTAPELAESTTHGHR